LFFRAASGGKKTQVIFQKWPRLGEMNKELIDQLRKLSCVKGKQRTWISGLSDAQLLEVFHRLQNGETAKSIGRHVQQAWGINPTSSIHAISQGILKFQKRCRHLLDAPAPPTQQEKEFPEPLGADYDPENSLASLDYIAHSMRERIIGMIEREKKTGIKHPYLSRELQALATLQKVILKQRAYELTHDDPLKEKRWANRQKGIQEKFGVIMKNTTQDDRNKMVSAIGRFLELVEQHSFTLQIGPDGKYFIPEKPDNLIDH
jgi:hypothetical protein